MAGALFAGVCYPSIEHARENFCSTWHVDVGGGAELRCAVAGEPGFTVQRYDAGAPTTSSVGQYPPMPDCDYYGGVQFAGDWGTIAMFLLVTIWAGKSLIGLFKNDPERA